MIGLPDQLAQRPEVDRRRATVRDFRSGNPVRIFDVGFLGRCHEACRTRGTRVESILREFRRRRARRVKCREESGDRYVKMFLEERAYYFILRRANEMTQRTNHNN